MLRRVGFYLPRTNYLKVMGPLVDHIAGDPAATYRAVLLLPRWQTSKPQLRVDADAMRRLWGGAVDILELPDVKALVDEVARGGLEALFSVQPAMSDMSAAEIAALREASVRQGTKWVALPDGFSQNGHIVVNTEEILQNWDLVCTVGARSIRFLESRLQAMAPEVARVLRRRTVVVGYPEFDGMARPVDERQVRATYGLPEGKPIIFVATAPRIVPLSVNTWIARAMDARFRGNGTPSLRGLLSKASALQYPTVLHYRRYLAALRCLADRNGAILVGKTRTKHQDPGYVTDSLDYLIDDQAFFPFTTLELLRISRLYFGFYSHTASEAILSGLYAVTALFMPPLIVQESRPWRELSKEMAWGSDGLWQVPGVSEVIDGTSPDAAARLGRLERAGLDSFRVDARGRATALKDFFNYPCNSSALVLDALSSC